MLVLTVLLFPSLPSPPFPGEMKQADLITSKEHEELSDVTAVARAQDMKFPEMVSDTANFLRGHGFDEEAKPIEGRQSRPSSICLCYVIVEVFMTVIL